MVSDPRIYARTDVLVPDEVRELQVLVCGAGMVGSWVTAALARMVQHVTVVDYDTVEAVNLGVQMYDFSDVGKSKVDAVSKHLIGFPVENLHGDILPIIDDADAFAFDVVVSAVDSMLIRQVIAQHCKTARISMFIDVRVLGEMVCVLVARNQAEYDEYLQTILPDDQVETAPCGAEGTVYSGLFAASRVAAVVNNHGRGVFIRKKEVWNVGLVELLDEDMNTGGSVVNTSEESSDQEATEEGFRQLLREGPQGHTADYTRQQVEYEAEGINRSVEEGDH